MQQGKQPEMSWRRKKGDLLGSHSIKERKSVVFDDDDGDDEERVQIQLPLPSPMTLLRSKPSLCLLSLGRVQQIR